ncbi:uncharacterized protein LOC6588301 [Drosophila persimilis]|uniref:uncharacterized protein LOC6588301 n=1 Tax=Drosophila persimilis TaxID=7234 RepID=UPI000F091A08|nr:uncharacterized protein LOC6588301 [Drosophila persimilis]
MIVKIKVVLILLLAQAVSGKTEQPHMTFLNNLIQSIHKEVPIRTLLMLQHHQDKYCSIQDWNPDGIPILRVNELIEIDLRKHFNHMSAALVCLEEPSHMSLLLDALAKSFDHLRYVRILLWTQGNPAEEFLKQISDKAEEHQFLQMIVLGCHQRGEVSLHRLCSFPSPQFERIENISSIAGSTFHPRELNYLGKKALVFPNRDSPVNYTTKYAPTGEFPVTRVEDKQIIEFALRYNLTLVLTEKQDSDVADPYFDIQLNPRPVLSDDLVDQIECVNTFSVSSLMVVVPCGRVTNITDVFHKLDLRTWLLYILSVYATFVVAETVIMVATHRISGRSYRLTNLNPCVNMRAFRAILGLPFPIGPRLTVSLRLLFLAMSLFGMIFSTFFSCKLSSLLTKLPLQPQVESFEQMENSGLTVIGERSMQPFIESEVDEESLNITFQPDLKPEFVPLSLQHLRWLLWILGCGYGLATVVFLVEVYMGNKKRKVENKVPASRRHQEGAAV